MYSIKFHVKICCSHCKRHGPGRKILRSRCCGFRCFRLCIGFVFLFPPHDLNYVRSGKSRKENREDNEHLVFKTFTSDCRDRTNMLPCCRNTQKSAPQRINNPRKKDEHHETHPVVGWLLCWSGCVGVNVHTARNTCVSASLSREIEKYLHKSLEYTNSKISSSCKLFCAPATGIKSGVRR